MLRTRWSFLGIYVESLLPKQEDRISATFLTVLLWHNFGEEGGPDNRDKYNNTLNLDVQKQVLNSKQGDNLITCQIKYFRVLQGLFFNVPSKGLLAMYIRITIPVNLANVNQGSKHRFVVLQL